jgi:hypothetical protein
VAGGGDGVARDGRGDAGDRRRRQRRGHDPARGRGRRHLGRRGAAGRLRLRLQHRAGAHYLLTTHTHYTLHTTHYTAGHAPTTWP